MTTPKRNYKRGTLPNQIEFDPRHPFSSAGGNGDIYQGKLHFNTYPDGSPFQYSFVALKRMRWGYDSDTRLGSIINETHIWMGLNHPNLLRFLGLLQDENGFYLVAPFAPHGSLPAYIIAHPHADRRMFLWQVAAGLAYLHGRSIVHGDVKGANILVFDGLTLKICDFGLSKIADGKQTPNPMFSLPWTSPERLLGEPRSYASDVYSFGMTIYEILSGEIPFRTLDSFSKVFQAICTLGSRPPPHPESCWAGVSYVLHWIIAENCWQRAPEKRMSMSDVRDALAPSEANTLVGDSFDDLPVLSMPSPYNTSHREIRMNKAMHEMEEDVVQVIIERDATKGLTDSPPLDANTLPGSDLDGHPVRSTPPPSSDTTFPRRKGMGSEETMQASESSRATVKRKICHNSIVGKGSDSQDPKPTSSGSYSSPSRFLTDLVDTSALSQNAAGAATLLFNDEPDNIESPDVPVLSGSMLLLEATVVIAEDDINIESSAPCNVTGHFCDLFAGKHTGVGKVALKRLRVSNRDLASEGQKRSFFREANTWQKLKHPFILDFVGVYLSSDHIYLVSPFIENGSMKDYIQDHPETDRLPLLNEVADALAYLHACGIIHGDVKSQNILITDDIHALLCDFGLTKLAGSSTSTEMKGAGTVGWQSPELLNNVPKSFQSDVYAFGITIYEVLSGKKPYYTYTRSPAVILAVIGGERPLPEPLVSPTGRPYHAAWALAQKCWEADPGMRPAMPAVSTQFRSICGSP